MQWYLFILLFPGILYTQLNNIFYKQINVYTPTYLNWYVQFHLLSWKRVWVGYPEFEVKIGFVTFHTGVIQDQQTF